MHCIWSPASKESPTEIRLKKKEANEKKKNQKLTVWAVNMAQWVKALTTKSDNLSSIPRTYMTDTEN